LTAVISYPEGEPHFINKYEQPCPPPCPSPCCQNPAELRLQARKTARGACLKENMFSFAVETPDGETVVTAKNGKDGYVHFPKICLNHCGTYRYVIREQACCEGGWTCDSRSYRVNVAVSEYRDGRLRARVQYPDGKPHFVNRFSCRRCRDRRL
jgi:pilin isopeptide linkage protein